MYERIRELREEKNLTQKQMAEYLHCSSQIYKKYECREARIPTAILIKLAEFHNTSTDYLLNLTDTKNPHPRT